MASIEYATIDRATDDISCTAHMDYWLCKFSKDYIGSSVIFGLCFVNITFKFLSINDMGPKIFVFIGPMYILIVNFDRCTKVITPLTYSQYDRFRYIEPRV